MRPVCPWFAVVALPRISPKSTQFIVEVKQLISAYTLTKDESQDLSCYQSLGFVAVE